MDEVHIVTVKWTAIFVILLRAANYRLLRKDRFEMWQQVTRLNTSVPLRGKCFMVKDWSADQLMSVGEEVTYQISHTLL